MKSAIAVDDVCSHMYGEAFDNKRRRAVGLADKIALHLVPTLTLLVFKVEGHIDLEICSEDDQHSMISAL